jgi:hypothetical protein
MSFQFLRGLDDDAATGSEARSGTLPRSVEDQPVWRAEGDHR